jgi:hypothetical protein
MPVVHAAPCVHAVQVPVELHTPPVQAVATGTILQVPVVQEWQAPQAVPQHTPPTQWPCAHWLSPEHTLPSAMVGAQAPPVPQ